MYLHSVDDEMQILNLPNLGREGLVFGRKGRQGYVPDVDLSVFTHSDVRGVSRRHAALITYKGRLCLIDLESANGTSMNGTRLIAGEPSAIYDQDTLCFGQTCVRLCYD